MPVHVTLGNNRPAVVGGRWKRNPALADSRQQRMCCGEVGWAGAVPPKKPGVTCWGGPGLKAKHRRCRPLSHDRRDGDSLRPLSYRFASFARGTLALPWPPRYDERLIRPTGHGAKGGDRRQAQHPLRTDTHWAVSRLRLRLDFATSFCCTSEWLRCPLVRACSAPCGWAVAYPVAMSPMALRAPSHEPLLPQRGVNNGAYYRTPCRRAAS